MGGSFTGSNANDALLKPLRWLWREDAKKRGGGEPPLVRLLTRGLPPSGGALILL
jgi:hypothetical protein